MTIFSLRRWVTVKALILQQFPVTSDDVRVFFAGAVFGTSLALGVSAIGAEAPAAKPPLIVLDPGHGGKDLGAVRRGGLIEKDLALSFSRKLQARLEKRGVSSKLTRESDVYVPLDARIHDSIEWGGSVFVSLHLNQDRNRKAHGIEVYAFGRERKRIGRRRRHGLPSLPAPPREASAASRDLADQLVRALKLKGFLADPPERAGFYVLKNPKIPSVLVELGYLSNPGEAKKLVDPAYQDRLADTLADTLREYVREPAPDTSDVAQAKK